MKTIESYIAEKTNTQIRFQEFGVGKFALIPTKSGLKKAIKKGLVLIDGKKAQTSTFIHGGEHIELLQLENKQQKQFIKELLVLHEDEHLAVVLKPCGISVSGNKFATIANCLAQNLKPSNQPDTTKPFPVHRLDYATSGLLLVGKTASARRALHEMFQRDEIQKTYHAVCVGQIKKQKGIIDSEIDEKPSLTEYQVLKSVSSEKYGALNLMELKPKTGRTHQLRKHLLSIGNPIMGDKKYFINELQHKGYGLYLHATRLSFTHPKTSKNMSFKSDLPKKFVRIFG